MSDCPHRYQYTRGVMLLTHIYVIRVLLSYPAVTSPLKDPYVPWVALRRSGREAGKKRDGEPCNNNLAYNRRRRIWSTIPTVV